jgi:predicted transcriptional regulator
MLELVRQAETIEAIREGLEAVAAGRTMSLDDFDAAMRAKHRIPSGT